MFYDVDAGDPAARHWIVLANPSPHSFCHAVAEAYAEEVRRLGQVASIRDLYEMAFDPVLQDQDRPDRGRPDRPWIDAELKRLGECAAIVFIYPIWFGGPPAILKGYIDRVIGAHCDFRHFMDQRAQPAVRNKWLASISTSGTPSDWLEARGQTTALRQGWDVYLERGFGLRDAGHLCLDRIVPHMSVADASAKLWEVTTLAMAVSDRLTTASIVDGHEPPIDADLLS